MRGDVSWIDGMVVVVSLFFSFFVSLFFPCSFHCADIDVASCRLAGLFLSLFPEVLIKGGGREGGSEGKPGVAF